VTPPRKSPTRSPGWCSDRGHAPSHGLPTRFVADRLVVSYRAADADADTVDADEDSGFAEDHIVHERTREPPFRVEAVAGGDRLGGGTAVELRSVDEV